MCMSDVQLINMIEYTLIYDWVYLLSRLRVFENRILRRIFGPKRMGSGEGFTMRNFIVCTVHLNLED